LHPVDAGIVLLFALWAVGSGLRARRRASKSLEEYFLAGRRLRGWQAGVSMAATQFAADTPLVVTGLVATAGLFSLWQLWSYGLAFLLLGFLFAPCWRRAGVLTDAEFAELRYSGRGAVLLRGIRAVLFGLVFNCVVVAMVLFAAVLFSETFLPWDQWLPGWLFAPIRDLVEWVGVPLAARPTDDAALWTVSTSNLISIGAMTGLALAYSSTGGLRSVVATDLVQFAIMMLGTAVFAGIAVERAGGLSGLAEALAGLDAAGRLGDIRTGEIFALRPSEARNGSVGLVAVFALQWLLQRNADGTGYLAQRAMACKSDADARLASTLFAFIQIGVRSLLWVPLALALLVLFPPAAELSGSEWVRDREASFVVGMRALLPVGALGLMLTGMLAALTSTIDTHMNWGASYLANDLYGRLWCRSLRGREPEPRRLVWCARLANGVIVVLALGIMTRLGSIQEAWKLTLVLGAGLGVVTVLRWLWWRINAWGELAAMAVSFAGSPFALAFTGSEAAQMLGMATAASAAAVLASFATAETDPETLRRFAERTRPPGWWGPFGAGGVHRLGRALLAAGAASVTLFAGLVACLRLLIPPPGAESPLLPLALLGLALAAVPVWLPALKDER
jgi:SSS family solute:Na+ symporter